MSADVPPPTLGSLSNMSTSSPSWRANCASPSGRLYAPENSTSRRAELWARDVASRVALAKASGRLEAVIGAVALSSCEAEIMAGSEAAKEAIYLSSFLRELGMDLSQPPPLKLDNKSAIDLAYNPEHHSKTKHIERRHYFIRECVENGKLRVPFVPTKENCADFFTKPLSGKTFFDLRDRVMNVPRDPRRGSGDS